MSVPALRFKDFSGDWKKKTLGDIGENIIGLTYSPSNITDDKSYPIVLRSSNIKNDMLDLNDQVRVKEKIPEKLFTNRDDILICTRNGSQRLIGKNVLISNTEIPMTFGAFMSVYRSPFNKFMVHLFKTDNYNEQIQMNLGARINQITTKNLNAFSFWFPSLPEQTKIANFLTAIDEKISLLTQKADLLSQYKKGVMQQIFSQELRFKDDDGQEFPEWEEKTLGDVCICLDNQRKPLNDAERQTMQGEFPYWGANNIMDYVDDYLFDETIVLLAEDGGNFNEYKTRPIANISHGKCWVNNHTHVLKGEIGLSNEFLFYSLVHKNITGYVSGGTRAKLTKGEMLKIEISIPNPAEQTKIANFLTAIDEKITNNQNQLNAVKQYKQGLLQQMFV